MTEAGYRRLNRLTVTVGFCIVGLAVSRGDAAVGSAVAFLIGVQVSRMLESRPVYPRLMKDFDPSKIRPLWNRALIEEDPKPTVSEGGKIILPDTARDAKYTTPATVLAVGRGKLTSSGTLIEIPFKVGDRVVLGKRHGVEIHGDRIRMVDVDVIEGLYEASESA
jgi:co-chaperonin GroES (HSP10)